MTDFIDSDGNGNPVAAPILPTYDVERSMEYPNLTEQLDMLWHAMDADSSKRLEPFYSTIKATKDKYPKE